MKSIRKKRRRLINEFYTLEEEIAHGVTHGLGALLSIAGLVMLLILAARDGTPWHLVSFSIYGATLITLYLASTLYHSIQHPRLRPALRIIDHAAIFVFIAGTYTPFLLISLRGPFGWTMLAVVWLVAIAGILFKIFFIGKMEVFGTLIYVAMGWLCIFAFEQMMLHVPGQSIRWLFAGGAVYTIGVLFYVWQKLPYNHAVWHLFVLGGSICHFFAVHSLLTASLA